MPLKKNRTFAIAYFRSGWAFLVPYLAIYLLYAWRKWPVNPSPTGFAPVCLLHVYWIMHGLHAMLGGLALRGWWLEVANQPHGASRAERNDILAETACRLAPWLLLALFFYIPGVYLEFPADPWEHYARINQWSNFHLLVENPVWPKSSYFLAYSFVGHLAPPSLQLKWLDLYYTSACLLLCWQYFRLGRAVGLSARAAFIFVLIQAATFGNNTFGFYRYYGISSTLFAQLGAIALIRTALVVFSPTTSGSQAKDGPESPRTFWQLRCAGLVGLVLLTGFNHPQSLVLAALGMAAVAGWRLTQWRTGMLGWLALAAAGLSVLVVGWYPRHPALDAVYRPQGWLTSWYGFNFLLPYSPAFSRAREILGTLGLLNLAAGACLLVRNHVVGWLTLLAPVVLCLPCFSIPLASFLATENHGEIGLYHRVFFCIPAGLALVVLLRHALAGYGRQTTARALSSHPSLTLAYPFLLAVAAVFALTPAGGPSFNRLFHAVMTPPDDLVLKHPLADLAAELPASRPPSPARLLVATPGLGFVSQAEGLGRAPNAYRTVFSPSRVYTTELEDELILNSRQTPPALLLLNAPFAATTPMSFIGYLSGHWSAFEIPLLATGGLEVGTTARRLAWKQASDTANIRLYLSELPGTEKE